MRTTDKRKNCVPGLLHYEACPTRDFTGDCTGAYKWLITAIYFWRTNFFVKSKQAAKAGTYAAEHSLNKHQVERYSRHLLLNSFGLTAQEKLCSSSVLIVGCGGLGSPAALYLAACGVGTLGLMDHDSVDASNLHRQVIHTEERVGTSKAQSGRKACEALNSLIKIRVHEEALSANIALSIIGQYDMVLDCSDNAPTRYLISDACVVTGKPLVSAAAVGTDGQLTVYNYGEDGPCYRCLFPKPPAPENCSRCSDAGVLGVVPGIMGALQALEAIKIASGKGDVLNKRMLVFDALSGKFMTVKLRSKRAGCAACGEHPTLSMSSLPEFDYKAFTGQEAQDGPPVPLQLIPSSERLLPRDAKTILDQALKDSGAIEPIVLDVRPRIQYQLMHLPHAVNIPIEELENRMPEVKELLSNRSGSSPLLVICRRGNASQLAVQQLRMAGYIDAVDIIGGMTQWSRDVDSSMPIL
ncbi:hypothetical protein CEUSTIGMA_g2775.t1 [Chlamydomonas eustigma]|uniref:Adenylyltransferase and sulfurtransferase MOCS3 n=1 Tax=Chlamydomonas eustigma TaxID=1157962 RepID=A0A250WXS3_9CHLO|nr:hypothetical protein CEUSTIGMA_g2775.t1 [Chlamydomonas eustigma]|eukprot:GAX75330.1 hypothetical protein CEUSTIGMA_g2775.t1 [Chlamydomonas eustigma]